MSCRYCISGKPQQAAEPDRGPIGPLRVSSVLEPEINEQRAKTLIMELGKDTALITPTNAIWTFWDVIGIFALCWLGIGITTVTTMLLEIPASTSEKIAVFVGGLLGILAPPWWLNSRHGLFVDAVGLKRGHGNAAAYTLAGLFGVIVFCVLMWLVSPARIGSPVQAEKVSTYFILLLLPASVSGFLRIVWSPMAEEVLFRGLLYGYLRTRIGVPLALIVQGLLFALVHFPVFKAGFSGGILSSIQIVILGVFLGFLYERTCTIYPCVICHGAHNYLAIVAQYFWATT
jgi:membrane protease YdiL (CAAX protease family)